MTTVSQAHYGYKGNASTIRSSLDDDMKKDLKASHFRIGSHPNDFNIYSPQKPKENSV